MQRAALFRGGDAQMAAGDLGELLVPYMPTIRVPKSGDRVYKTECAFSYDSPVSAANRPRLPPRPRPPRPLPLPSRRSPSPPPPAAASSSGFRIPPILSSTCRGPRALSRCSRGRGCCRGAPLTSLPAPPRQRRSFLRLFVYFPPSRRSEVLA